jgi:peptidoglycan/LPS O-acetylase OafA/YrhL
VSAPAALAPPPGHPRFPHVDGLRALAALGVVAVHVSALAGITASSWLGAYTARLNVGVAIFFCVSGFLLYRPFAAAAHAARPRIRTGEYLRRRALRIVPAYWLALTVLAIYPGLPGVFTRDWWIYYGFGQIYQVRTTLGGISPAWTLCVEVTFYLVLPLYAALAARATRGMPSAVAARRELWALAALSLVSLGFRAVLFGHPRGHVAISTLPGMVTWFAGGMALAVLSVRAELGAAPGRVSALARRPWLPWLAALVLFWVTATRIGAPRTYDPADYTGLGFAAEHVLYAAIAALVVLPAVLGAGERGARRVLSTRVLAAIGVVSYGLFLWHLPLLVALRDDGGVTGWLGLAVLGLAASLACATLSYVLVERPALRRKERSRGAAERAGQPVAAGR